MNPRHLVTGAGPVGSTLALQLAEAGHPVRLVSRSGRGPEHQLIERTAADVSQASTVAELMAGIEVVHHCIHGSQYVAATWRRELPAAEQIILDAAADVGAVVVFPESLYAYGKVSAPMTEDTPHAATTGKSAIRVELLAAREAHRASTVSVCASDFYGPRVIVAHAGDRIFPRVLAGKSVSVMGSPDQPHSFTYVPDLTRAMIEAGHRRDLWDTVLHAPTVAPLTQRELVTAVARAAEMPTPKVSTLPVWLLRILGVAMTGARELAETGHMFTGPFVMDSTRSEQELGLSPTPLTEGLAETVTWWREQSRTPNEAPATVGQ